MKITFSLVADTLFSAFVTFILSFVILNYFCPRPFSIIYASVLAVLVSIIAVKKLSEKQSNRKYKSEKERQISAVADTLNTYTRAEQTNLLERAILKTGVSVERRKGGIFIPELKCAVFCRFGFEGVNKADVVKIFNTLKKGERAYVFAQEFSAELSAFIERFRGRIIAVNQTATYKFLKENSLMPKEKIAPENKKIYPHGVKKAFLKKANAKKYFLSGLAFLIFSYFVPLNLYYVISGSILLFVSLLTKLYGFERETATA
jgi:hypothetical protein